MREQLRPEDLAQYAITAADADFEGAVGGAAALRAGGLVTVKAADGGKGRKRGADADGKHGGKGGGGGGKAGGGGGGGGGKKQKGGGGGGGGDGRQQKKGKPRQ